MDAREFAEWIAYDAIEPFGGNREDQRAGTIVAAIINQHRRSPTQWSDFLPPYEKRKPSTDWRDLLAKVEALNVSLGGEDRRIGAALDD
jgi:hypothetical protein